MSPVFQIGWSFNSIYIYFFLIYLLLHVLSSFKNKFNSIQKPITKVIPSDLMPRALGVDKTWTPSYGPLHKTLMDPPYGPPLWTPSNCNFEASVRLCH